MKRKQLLLLLVLCNLLAAADSGSMLLRDWLRAAAFRQLDARRSEVNRITTRAEAEARGRQVRAMLLRMMGGLPQQRTPLNLRTTGVIDRGDYRVEKLIYESLPKFYVTANLYVPQTGRGPFPAVLQPIGHSTQAKSRAFYQTLALGLVKKGFVVLNYDPLGQGERRIFYDADMGDSKVGGATVEHQMVGIQSLLAGESIARYMVWDGLRSIDVLASLSEVDGSRIGVVGCSGGGTLTAYLAAIDDRLKAAAPACYITAWEEQLSGTGPQDAEQQFPDQLKDGLDHADFATAFAPRPYLQVNTEEDFFPIAGARRAIEEARRIYGLYNAGDKISWAVGPGGHGMPQVVREAIYGWMNHWLKGGLPGSLPEPPFQTEYEEALYCTPTGQVSTSLGGETASTVNMKRYAQIRPQRPALSAPADLEALRTRIRDQIRTFTRYQTPNGPVDLEIEPPTRREGYSVRTLTYGAPGGRRVPGLLAVPDTPRGKAVLLVSEQGASAALRPRSDGDALARLGHAVLAVDAAGFGSTAGQRPSDADNSYGPDKLAWLAVMTGEPLVGLGIEDILRGLDVLADQHLLGTGCIGFAEGITGVALLHAAALDTRLAEVIVAGGLTSYEAVAHTPIHRRILSGVVPGVLGKYDLPDLAACVAPRPLTLVNLRLPAGQPALLKVVRDAYRYAVDAYAAGGAPERLTMGLRREDEAIDAAYQQFR
jgi:cephalosporin-C deacetylase-like acetyl esterase